MDRKYTNDGIRALTVLGCKNVERLKIGQDFHVVGRGPDDTRIYCVTLEELQGHIIRLSRL